MKKLFYLSIIFIGLSVCQTSKVNAQGVGINSSGNNPDPSAILDLNVAPANNKGLLIPRITTTERDAIASPAQSLMIYNLTTKCLEVWENGLWQMVWCAACPIPTGATASASPDTLCEGDTLTLTGGATYATSWSWAGPNSFTSTLQSPTISSITTAGAGVYSLTASNTCGAATAVSTASVTVNNVPTLVMASASPDPICAGNDLTLTGGATDATSWSWTGPNGFTSTSQSPTISNITTAGAGIYTLTASNACGAATAVSTASVTVNTACFTCGTSTISDFDGNIYNTVNIGTQCWMQQNLKTTKYSNGIAMVDGTSAGDITGNYTTKYYFDYADNPTNTATYGKLYTWAAVMNGAATSNSDPSGVQGPCPTGWHVPSDAEWSSLISNQGGSSVAGCYLKEAGLSHWLSPNFCADNSSGFTALPGGYRHNNGTFGDVGYLGYWWSSTESSSSNAWYIRVNYSISDAVTAAFNKSGGWSVRCLKD